ncbi:MAG TPA: AsmA-like C-terminal region-containing protein, partial [Puia sp.]|nr:AsmA-like C-terminal region-containing protein [Puia sp.]
MFWAILAIYVEWDKDTLLEKARSEINTRIGGTLQIGHAEISLFRHFPAVSVSLSDVSLRDSAWQQHRHDLLQAQNIYISFSPFRSLFHRRVELGAIFIENGSLYFYTDSTGYSNTYLLKGRSGPVSSTSSSPEGGLPTVVLSDVRWVMDRQDQHKLFDLAIRRLTGIIDREGRVLRFDVTTTLTARDFSFNTEKGSFIRGKVLSGHFGFTYNLASHILQADKARLDIDGYPFVFTGRFFPTVKPDPLILSIDAERVPFRAAAALLTQRLEQKLDEYNIDKPIDIHAQLDAGAADDPQPQLQVRFNLQKGNVVTPAGSFTDVSFSGSFTNDRVRGHGHDDGNSAILLTGFSGQVGGIPLHADSLLITDLVHPQLSCDLHSRFDITALNDVYGSQTLQFRGGSCGMDLLYKGPMSENDTAGATVNGHLDLDSAAIVYLPYPFALSNIHGRLLFRDQDLVVDHLEARAGNTRVQIKGAARNLIELIDHNSESVGMDWTLSTAHLSVEDFAVLAGRVSTASSRHPSGSPALGAAAARIDNFLKAGTIHLVLNAGDIRYQDFTGAHAKADLIFRAGEIRLSRMTVEQNSGLLDLSATLVRRHEASANPLTLDSHFRNVDLPGLFRSFDNFGLKGIGARNLKGKLNADMKLTGLLTDKARIVPNSLKGTIGFSIADGQLINWEPMEKINETVLKKRDMSAVLFGPLQNELDVDSSTLTLHRMEIQSTAFTLYAEGTYDLRKGADMSLQVPLSNLKARAADVPPESRGNDSKAGLSLRLRARTGDDGNLKISWDPF